MELSQCLFSGKLITAVRKCQNEFSFNHSSVFLFFHAHRVLMQLPPSNDSKQETAELCSKKNILSESQHFARDPKCVVRKVKINASLQYTTIVLHYLKYSQSSIMHVSPLWFCPVFVLASGLQAILPEYLRARFVQAALSYIGCNEEGQFVCRDNDCWCQCTVDYPQCNCPEVDLRAMEASLLQIRLSWNTANQDFEESGQCFGFFPSLLHRVLTAQPLKQRSNYDQSV